MVQKTGAFQNGYVGAKIGTNYDRGDILKVIATASCTVDKNHPKRVTFKLKIEWLNTKNVSTGSSGSGLAIVNPGAIGTAATESTFKAGAANKYKAKITLSGSDGKTNKVLDTKEVEFTKN